MDDETLLANNSNEEPVGQKQAVDCHTHEQYFGCKLLKILNDVNAPHYLFQFIMNWQCRLHISTKAYNMQGAYPQSPFLVESTCISISSANTDQAAKSNEGIE